MNRELSEHENRIVNMSAKVLRQELVGVCEDQQKERHV